MSDDVGVMRASLTFARMRILLLEDDQETAEALAKGLSNEGHQVSVAGDVAAASALIASMSFDAAVLDVMVPDGSGYDVLGQLSALEPVAGRDDGEPGAGQRARQQRARDVAVVDDEHPRPGAHRRTPTTHRPRAAPIAPGAIAVSAAPQSSAALGMPNTADEASS